MSLLSRYSKISIVSTILGNTISATDLGVYTCLGSNVFTFEENGKNYSFMVLNFRVNGKGYLLSGNKKLKELILSNLPKGKINTIKEKIINASKLDKDKKIKKDDYIKLEDKVEVVQLYSTQASNGSIRYVIKDENGSYYKYYDDFLKKENDFSLASAFGTTEWAENSYDTRTIYVINNLSINDKTIEDKLKLCDAIDDYEGERINSNLYSWCEGRDFESFGKLNTNMDFEKLILSYYKSKYENYKVDEAYELGYLSDTLDHYVTKFKKQLQSFIDNNTEYDLFVKLMTKRTLDYHYKEHNEYIKVRPNMTYGELFRAIIKKCREIEGISDDSTLIRKNDLSINDTEYKEFDDIVALSKNNDKIKIDIEELEFKYYTSKYFDPNDNEDMFWKELNGLCENKENKPVKENLVEKETAEKKLVKENQVENKQVSRNEQSNLEQIEKVKNKLVDEEPAEREQIENKLAGNEQGQIINVEDELAEKGIVQRQGQNELVEEKPVERGQIENKLAGNEQGQTVIVNQEVKQKQNEENNEKAVERGCCNFKSQNKVDLT